MGVVVVAYVDAFLVAVASEPDGVVAAVVVAFLVEPLDPVGSEVVAACGSVVAASVALVAVDAAVAYVVASVVAPVVALVVVASAVAVVFVADALYGSVFAVLVVAAVDLFAVLAT